MISSDFYHTGEITANGMVLTNDLRYCADITDVTSDFAAPYYMGYVKYDEMPVNMNFGFYDLVDSTHLEFYKQTPRNHAWGFGTCMNNGGQPEGGLVYIDSNTQMKYHPTQYYDGTYHDTKYRFINQAKLAGLAYANVVNVYGAGMIVPAADLDENDTAFNFASNTDDQYKLFGGQITCGVVPGSSYTENIEDFLNGDCDLDFGSVTIDGHAVPIKISISDFTNTEAPVVRKPFTLNGTDYVLFFTIQTYRYQQFAKYNDGNNSYAVAVVPFVEYDDPKEYGSKWYCFGDNTSNSDTIKVTLEYNYGCTITAVTPYGREYYMTGFLGDFFIEGDEMYGSSDVNHPEDCWWYGSNTGYHFPGYGRNGVIRGRHIVTMESNMNGAFFMRKMVWPQDMYNHYMLFHKIDKLHTYTDVSATQTYTTNYSVALFDELNKPKNERVEENYGAALLEKLRPWQYPNMDLSIDEFTIDDVPEYNPTPGPGDDDTLDQFSGDNISLNLGDFGATNGFITHWVMSKGQVSTFGSYVWQNLLDFDAQDDPLPGVWENLKIAGKTYFTTGSIDPASLMDLIIGLRYYPFDLENESSASADNCIYFGTGKYGVPVRGPGEYTRTLDNMAFHLSAAAIVLPSTSQFWYKDFRDYEGSTAFIYLPFCGTYQIPISEIVPNTQFDIDYEVDLATGSCTAYVKAVHASGTSTGAKTYPVVVANGQCGFEVPLSATNANRLNATIIADAQKVVGAIAGPVGDSVGKVMSGVTSAIAGGADIQVNGLEDIDVAGAAAISAGGPMGGVAALGGQTALNAGGNLANVAAGMATRSGCSIPLLQGGRGWSALANPLTPYIQIRRGRYMYAKGYEHAEGKPENRQKSVSSITGFFQCDNVDMSGVGATSAEVNMIKRMLETGVYHK